MKTLEFIYQETQIHFLINPLDKNVMVNATEMAKLFNKQIDNFRRLDGTKNFIEALLESEKSKVVPSDVREQMSEKDLIFGTNKATFMNRKLAIYFAFWLDVKFQIWIIDTIDEIVFGNYKKHWEAHAVQEEAKEDMKRLKVQMLTNPSIETNRAYFEALERRDSAKKAKTNAIRNQLKFF